MPNIIVNSSPGKLVQALTLVVVLTTASGFWIARTFAEPAQGIEPAAAQPPSTVAQAFFQLVNADLSGEARQNAAAWLLHVDNNDSIRALKSVLHQGVAPEAWQAVARAITMDPSNPPSDLASPMISLLPVADAATREVLAQALGRYHDDDLIKQLVNLAGNKQAKPNSRCGAILTLGHHRTQDVTEFLLSLTDLDQPEQVRAAAFDALATLTGLDRYGSNRSSWLNWWDNARHWSREKWDHRLMAYFARRDAKRLARQHTLEERLIESQRALYRTTTPKDRSAVLAYMLNDSLPVVRNLALDLSLQRLVDDLSFDEPLRQALRARLDDSDASIRRRATLLLRDLADKPAADHVADKLAQNREQSVSVLGAYLLMMARLPRAQAVEPALVLLAQPPLRSQAAAALASDVDAKMLSDGQKRATARRLHQALRNGQPPSPQVVTLLAKVGNDDDWSRIARWVDSADPTLKRAAALAWAQSSHSLQLLADRASDPVIEPIVIAAATRKGNDPWTLRALINHRPNQPQGIKAWEGALTAMAGRVPPRVVLESIKRLEALKQPATLLDQMLSAAIARDDKQVTTQDKVTLRLKRASIRLVENKPTDALTDYQKVLATQSTLPAKDQLGAREMDQLYRGMVRARLTTGDLDQAFKAARNLVKGDGEGAAALADDPILNRFLEAARHDASTGHGDIAEQILTKLRALLGSAIKPEVAQRIALLEAQIASTPKPSAVVQSAP